MAGRWVCGGGTQPVRVVHGDGQVLSLVTPVRVADILVGHPHHYICHMSPDLPSNKSAMLPLAYELEPGYVYFLLPLPRLFPTSAAGPPSCCCRSSNHDRSLEEGHTTPTAQLYSSQKGGGGGFSPLMVKAVKQMVDKIGSPIRSAKKKVSPELSRSPAGKQDSSPLLSPTYGASKHSKRGGGSPGRRCVSPNSSPNRLRENANARSKGNNNNNNNNDYNNNGNNNGRCFMENLCTKWKPGLGRISETGSFVTACEELRLCLDRRRLTFDCKVRSNSPLKLSDVCRGATRDMAYSRFPMEGYNDRPAKEHMSLAGYIFA